MLLSKAWSSFEADKRIEGFSPQTLKAYQLQSLLLIGYFKDVEMELLDKNQLKEYLAIAGQHLKPANLAHRICFIKSQKHSLVQLRKQTLLVSLISQKSLCFS